VATFRAAIAELVDNVVAVAPVKHGAKRLRDR